MVGCGYYCIVGDSLAPTSQKAILMVGITGFMVKTVKQELEVDDTLPQCFDALASFVFIKFFDSSLAEDLTPLFSLTKFVKGIIQFVVSLLSKPSIPMGSI